MRCGYFALEDATNPLGLAPDAGAETEEDPASRFHPAITGTNNLRDRPVPRQANAATPNFQCDGSKSLAVKDDGDFASTWVDTSSCFRLFSRDGNSRKLRRPQRSGNNL